MRGRARLLAVALVLRAGLALAAELPAAAELPIFDAHIHYSQGDWDALSPEQALALLAAAGVRRALVSSTPDDGTLRLWAQAPRAVVPFLRPYRTREDMATWPRDLAIAAYVEARLARGIYRGLGEFHLGADDVEAPTVRRLAALARARDLFLHAHGDAVTVERLLTRYAGVKVLWAHAGLGAPPGVVSALLDRFPQLWVELALRGDVAPGGQLDPAWRAAFLRHPDRFLVGTDTWVTARWHALPEAMREVRRWLGQLPPDVAARIAFGNGERLFPAPTE